MLNLKDFAIDLSEISINYEQMRNATEVAVKSAISSTMIIADQVQDGYKKLHLNDDNVEIVVAEGIAMIILKENIIVSDIDHLASMKYSLANFSLSQLVELLSALVTLGQKYEKGDVEFDHDFSSKGLDLFNKFLDVFGKTNIINKHVMYKNHNVVIRPDEIVIDGMTLFKDGIYYYL